MTLWNLPNVCLGAFSVLSLLACDAGGLSPLESQAPLESQGPSPQASAAPANVSTSLDPSEHPSASMTDEAPVLGTKVGGLSTDCATSVMEGHADAKSDCCPYLHAGNSPPVPVTVMYVDSKPIELDTGNALLVMGNAASNDPANPVQLSFSQAMRPMKDQMKFWQCFACTEGEDLQGVCPEDVAVLTPSQACGACTYDVGDGPQPCTTCNLAACPGTSNHQMGISIDFNLCAGAPNTVACKEACKQFNGQLDTQIQDCMNESPMFSWLMENGNGYGFFRNVTIEAWHWTYQPWKNPGPGGGPCSESCEHKCLPMNANGDSTGILNPDCSVSSCGLLGACTEAFGAPECISAFCNEGTAGLAEGEQCMAWGDLMTCDAAGQVTDIVDCPDDEPCSTCGDCGSDCTGACEVGCSPASSNGYSTGFLDDSCVQTPCPPWTACTEANGAPECLSIFCLDLDDKTSPVEQGQCWDASENASYISCADPLAPEIVECLWLEDCYQLADEAPACAFFGCINPDGGLFDGPTCIVNNNSVDCGPNGEVLNSMACGEQTCNACGTCGPAPPETCNGVDDDCNGSVDEGLTNACGACGDVPPETCNGVDDDCDESIDEGLTNACGTCGDAPQETCNEADDDCDGSIDEGCPSPGLEDAGSTESDATTGVDASETDASETDASETDASETDASETDASETDASETDAGPTSPDVTAPETIQEETSEPQDIADGQELELEPADVGVNGGSSKKSSGCAGGPSTPSWLAGLVMLWLARRRRLAAAHGAH
jgi:hypothetical protein